jgi:tubulin polyglutamylase TTLL6/13
MDNLFMHLTNYAINKKSSDYVQNNEGPTDDPVEDDGAHKRGLQWLWEYLGERGYDTYQCKKDIENICIKTIITAQPSLQHIMKSCKPDDLENTHCF